MFSNRQCELIRELVCVALVSGQVYKLLDYLANNAFFAICEGASLEVHLTNQFKRVS